MKNKKQILKSELKQDELILKKEPKQQVSALSIKGLYKRYGRNKYYSVADLSFEVKSGEFHGFIGANGAGKTTTIKSIIGAYAKFRGEVKIFGHKYSSIEGKKKIGYIPETANFPKELDCFQYLKKMAILSGMTGRESADFANQKLKDVGMEYFKRKKPYSFSSGQKKKILLAQALIGEPDLIIMDEPAANLDPKARSEFFQVLKTLQAKGKAIFISSHILAELEQFVDTVTIIDRGQLIYTGKTEDVKKTSTDKYFIKAITEEETKKIFDFLTKKKLKASKNNKKEIACILKDKKNLYDIYSFLTKMEIDLQYLKKDSKTLQTIYDDFVGTQNASEVSVLETKRKIKFKKEQGVKNA